MGLDGDVALVVTLGVLAAAVAAGSYAWGRWIAVLWLGAFLWAGSPCSPTPPGRAAWDRSGEYEPLPLSMFMIPFGVPLFCAASAAGVAARRAARPRRRASPRG